MKVTREMISAAHGVTMEHGDIVLSHRLLEKIYLAMDALANQGKISSSPLVPLTDEAIDAIIKSNFVEITNQNLYDAIYLCMRDVESAHDIEDQK